MIHPLYISDPVYPYKPGIIYASFRRLFFSSLSCRPSILLLKSRLYRLMCKLDTMVIISQFITSPPPLRKAGCSIPRHLQRSSVVACMLSDTCFHTFSHLSCRYPFTVSSCQYVQYLPASLFADHTYLSYNEIKSILGYPYMICFVSDS